MFVPKTLDRSVADAARALFPDSWLESPDDCVLPNSSTKFVTMPPNGEYLRFSTNYERFAAQEMSKRLDSEAFTKKGFIMQAIAAGWHHKSPAQLKYIGDSVGRDRIQVMHGTMDNLISVHHGKELILELAPRKSFLVDGAGHVLMLERTEWFNELVEEMFQETEKMEKEQK
jgi:pimeloyl-ACP methyl ester carboxylesterase